MALTVMIGVLLQVIYVEGGLWAPGIPQLFLHLTGKDWAEDGKQWQAGF